MDDSLDNLTTCAPEFGPTSQLEAGQFIGEHKNYRLEKSLGMGGMGEVWLATEIRGGKEIRSVVCKTLKPGRRERNQAQEKALKQFRENVRLVIQYPNEPQRAEMMRDYCRGLFVK